MASGVGNGSVRLSVLIDHLVQKTYHDLTILSELLPRKSDVERKVEIAKFATRTRQQFISLLAVVKWAASADKVDKCQEICRKLEEQSVLFVDTADKLSSLSREVLPSAVLPNFPVLAAVDVLTTGTYSRLPTCIKDKIVPPEAIAPEEMLDTLKSLDHLIQQRLLTSMIPKAMQQNIKLGNGRVTFIVENEFMVILTLVGDDESMPWRLLEIKILLEDEYIEIGEKKPLIHQSQVGFLHNLAQSRLFTDADPLVDLYYCLHFFCLSLQLDILYTQALQLKQEKWGDNLIIREYVAANSLVLQYWRPAELLHAKESPCQMTIRMDSSDSAAALQVQHTPPMDHSSEELHTPHYVAVQYDRLSVENLMNSVLFSRAKDKVLTLKERLEKGCPGIAAEFVEKQLSSLVLQWPAIWGEMHGIEVTVDWSSGRFKPLLEDCQSKMGGDAKTEINLDALEEALNVTNKDPALLAFPLLNDLRCRFALLYHERSASCLPMEVSSHLPICNAETHSLKSRSPFKLFFRLTKQKAHCIVIEISLPKDGSFSSPVTQRAFLLQLKPCRLNFEKLAVALSPGDDEFPWENASFVMADLMLPIGLNCLRWTQEEEPKTSILSNLVTFIVESLPFVELSEKLTEREIPHCGIQLEADSSAVLRVLRLPLSTAAFGKTVVAELNRALLDCSFRVKEEKPVCWLVELLLGNVPLETEKNADSFRRLFFSYKSESSVADQLLADWKAIAKLYGPVLELSAYMNDKLLKMPKSFQVVRFDYKKIVLSYGPDKQFTVSIWWSEASSGFQLTFGSKVGSVQANPHIQIAARLLAVFNRTRCIPLLMKGLHHTLVPFAAVQSLDYSPKAMIGVKEGVNVPYKPFLVLFFSPSRFRLVFRNLYAVEVQCQTDDILLIRDAAYSQADATQVLKGLATIPCFKHFLHGFSERCRLQESSVAVSSAGGLQSPVQSAPPIVTPSATTNPSFPTLPTRSSASTAPSSPRQPGDMKPPKESGNETKTDASAGQSQAAVALKEKMTEAAEQRRNPRMQPIEVEEDSPPFPSRNQEEDPKVSDNPFSVESTGQGQTTTLSAFSPSFFGMSPADLSLVNPSPSMLIAGSDGLSEYELSVSPGFLPHDGASAGAIFNLPVTSPSEFMGLAGTPQDMLYGVDLLPASTAMSWEMTPPPVTTSHGDLSAIDQNFTVSSDVDPAESLFQSSNQEFGLASKSSAVDSFGDAVPKSPDEDLLADLPSIPGGSAEAMEAEGTDDSKVYVASPSAAVLSGLPSLPPPKPLSPLSKPLSQLATIFTPPSHLTLSPHSPNAHISVPPVTTTGDLSDSRVFPSLLQANLSQQMQSEGWAAACPALIHQTVFYSLLNAEPFGQQDTMPLKRPFQSPLNPAFSDYLRASPLEHYLGSVFLLHHLTQRVSRLGVPVDTVVTRGDSVAFRVGCLQCTIELDTSSSTDFLKFGVACAVETGAAAGLIGQAELRSLQSFFRCKVACPPYSVEALTAFIRLLDAPPRLLRDCIGIMDMETDRKLGSRWQVKLCLTIPPNCKGQASAGIKTGAAAVVCRSKLLLFIQMTSLENRDLVPTTLPILCTLASNEVSIVDKILLISESGSPSTRTVSMAQQLIANYAGHLKGKGSVLLPMVNELVTNLPLPA